MGKTISEKILSFHARQDLKAGDFAEIEVSICLGNDVTAPLAIREFEKAGFKRPLYPDRVCLIPDHFTPNKDIRSAEQCKYIRLFAKRHSLKNYFEVGRGGIEHVLLPELGLVLPGDIIIGADSHTCTYGALGAFSTGVGSTDLAFALATGKAWFRVPETIRIIYKGGLKRYVTGKDLILYTISKIGVNGALYKTLEFAGEVIQNLPMADRFTMCNMAIEAGAKAGIVEPDATTEDYVKERAKREYIFFNSDKDCVYTQVLEIETSGLEPQVASPPLPSNSIPVGEVTDIRIDQAVIGSCTNGRIEDLRLAASILSGRKVHKDVRLLVIPATQQVYKQAIKEGLIEVFLDAGGCVSTPTCGPCLGGHLGVLADGERAISTTNRNFVGRMGHPCSEIYLSNPAVAAASAVVGKIVHPEEV